jgi:MFS family permease
VARRPEWAAKFAGDQHSSVLTADVLMPVVALARSFAVFVVGRSVVNFALNGEWSLAYLLVAETWPGRLRGRVVSINRATWCFGVSLAGVISGIAAAF